MADRNTLIAAVRNTWTSGVRTTAEQVRNFFILAGGLLSSVFIKDERYHR